MGRRFFTIGWSSSTADLRPLRPSRAKRVPVLSLSFSVWDVSELGVSLDSAAGTVEGAEGNVVRAEGNAVCAAVSVSVSVSLSSDESRRLKRRRRTEIARRRRGAVAAADADSGARGGEAEVGNVLSDEEMLQLPGGTQGADHDSDIPGAHNIGEWQAAMRDSVDAM